MNPADQMTHAIAMAATRNPRATRGGVPVPVPDFQTTMLPLLESVRDGNEYSVSELADLLADKFELTSAERNERIQSGETRFKNRVRWANAYMKKALLLESAGRGRIRITPRGLQLLQENPGRVDSKLLMRYPEYVEFASPGGDSHVKDVGTQDEAPVDRTPHETMELAYREMRESLAQELLARIKTCSPEFFENMVLDILVAMGYGGSRDDAAQSVGGTGDGGVPRCSGVRGKSGWRQSTEGRSYPKEVMSDGFFGLSIGPTDRGPLVVVNVWGRISVERWILTAAHELGHLLLHPD